MTDKDYEHVKKVWEAFEIKSFGEYHDLYVQCDTLLLADVFENFRNKCIEIYELDPAHFFVCTRISMASMFKKDKNRTRIINRYWYVIDGWEGTRGGICQATHRCAEANNKYMKDYDKTMNQHI